MAVSVAEGTAVKGGGGAIYLVRSGTRRWIPNGQTLDRLGIKRSEIRKLSGRELAVLPEGPSMPALSDGRLVTGSRPVDRLSKDVAPTLANVQEAKNALLAEVDPTTSAGAITQYFDGDLAPDPGLPRFLRFG